MSRKPRHDLTLAAVLTLLVTVVVTCDRQPPATSSGKVLIAVSIAPQAWLVRQIGGEHVEVMTVVRPGQSPSTYAPSEAQVSKLLGAKAYFHIGVPFERLRWFTAVKLTRKVRIIDTRAGITLRQMRSSLETDHDHAQHKQHEHFGKDPHIWTSPPLLIQQARTVAASLSELDPQHAGDYGANLAALETRLNELHARLAAKLELYKGSVFFVFHPSWGYFADAYGLQQMAVEIEGKAPTDRELTRLLELAREHDVKVMFVQPQIGGRAAAAIAETIGARVQTLDPLAEDVITNLEDMADALIDASPQP